MYRGVSYKECCRHSQEYMQLKKACQSVQIQPICIADADHDYILNEIELRDHIYYKRQVYNDDK